MQVPPLAATAKRLDLDNNLMALTDRAAPIIGTLNTSERQYIIEVTRDCLMACISFYVLNFQSHLVAAEVNGYQVCVYKRLCTVQIQVQFNTPPLKSSSMKAESRHVNQFSLEPLAA